jgi:hypothetical protein
MRGYNLADWELFFSAIITAAAALTALLGIVGAVYNAWVLLVEIVR